MSVSPAIAVDPTKLLERERARGERLVPLAVLELAEELEVEPMNLSIRLCARRMLEDSPPCGCVGPVRVRRHTGRQVRGACPMRVLPRAARAGQRGTRGPEDTPRPGLSC